MRACEPDNERVGRQSDHQKRGDDELEAAFGRSATPPRPNERPSQRCDDSCQDGGQQRGTNVQGETFESLGGQMMTPVSDQPPPWVAVTSDV